MAHDLAEELLRDLGLLDELLGDTVRAHSGEDALALVEGIEGTRSRCAPGRSRAGATLRRARRRARPGLARAGRPRLHPALPPVQRRRGAAPDPGAAPPRPAPARRPTARWPPPAPSWRAPGSSADEVRALLDASVRDAGADRAPDRGAAAHRARSPRPDLRRARPARRPAARRARAPAHPRAAARGGRSRSTCTEEARASRPSPRDEVRAGLEVFETDAARRDAAASTASSRTRWPRPGRASAFAVPPFLRWGTWIGGDRDGNPHVTADVTRARARAPAPARPGPPPGRRRGARPRAGRVGRAGPARCRSSSARWPRTAAGCPEVAARARPRAAGELAARSCGTCWPGCRRPACAARAATPTRPTTAPTSTCIDASLRGARLGAPGRRPAARRAPPGRGVRLPPGDPRPAPALGGARARGGRAACAPAAVGRLHASMTEEGRIALLGRPARARRPGRAARPLRAVAGDPRAARHPRRGRPRAARSGARGLRALRRQLHRQPVGPARGAVPGARRAAGARRDPPGAAARAARGSRARRGHRAAGCSSCAR